MVGGWIGTFIMIVTAGIGALAIPITALAGGIVGGVIGFSLGMEAAKSDLGYEVTKQLAPGWEYNEAAMKWCERLYMGMVHLENNAMRSYREKMRLARGLAVEGQTPTMGHVRAALNKNTALTPDFHNVNTKIYLEEMAKAGYKQLTPEKIKMLLGGKEPESVRGKSDAPGARNQLNLSNPYATDHSLGGDANANTGSSTAQVLPTQELMTPLGDKRDTAKLGAKVIPDDILLKKNRRDRVIRTLNREFKSHQKTMLDDPSSKDRLVPRLAAINQEILNLINAPLNEDKTHFIVNHQEIKDVSRTTTTVTQSSSGFISYGTNINAHGFAPSGRY